jgi:ribosomal protein S18 acetylase RimI-like enzyme
VVQWLEKVASTAGTVNIFVQARKANTGAIRFYEKLGFHIIGEAEGYYQRRESAVIMCKGIRPMFCNVQGIETKRYGQ